MYDVGCKADPAFLVMAIYVHGCTYAWVLAISSFSQRNPAREVGAKVPSSFRWQRIHHKSPVFCNRHCLNVCEQIRKTHAEPQWIVAQRVLSALTRPRFTQVVCKGAADDKGSHDTKLQRFLIDIV